MKNKKDIIFLGFLCALSIGGMGLVYIATSRIGPGVSTDGTIYLSVADNLLKGRGFIDLYGSPLTSFPPLYPALIASISWLTRADIFLAGQYINIITFGLIIFLSGILFKKTYPDRMLFAYIGCTFIASSVAVIDICASILSDSLFFLIIVLFLLASKSFTDTRKSANLFWMGLLACFASLERYAGLVLIVIGVIYLIRFYWKDLRQGLLKGALFATSGLPIFLWGVFHNYPISGWQFLYYGPAGISITLSMTNIIGNVYWIITKILYWFFPYAIIKMVNPFGVLAVILLALILLNQLSTWNMWFQGMIDRASFVNTILIPTYLGMIIFYTQNGETNSLTSQRYEIALITSLLIVLFAMYEGLIPPHSENLARIKDGILIAIFILWLVYPVSGIQSYEQQVRIKGEIANNTFNFVNIRESNFLKTAENLSASQQVYSNYEPAAWFYLRRDISSIPRVDPKSKQYIPESLTRFQDSINSSKGGYLVWFNTINYRGNLPTLGQIHQTVKMEPLFTSDVGNIYQISSNTP